LLFFISETKTTIYFLYFSLNCLSKRFSATKGSQIHKVLFAPLSKKSASDWVKNLKATYKIKKINIVNVSDVELIYFFATNFSNPLKLPCLLHNNLNNYN